MLSRVLRRTHMYLALFLTPWVLMYTVSTLFMNHRQHLRGLYGEPGSNIVKEAERNYVSDFSPNATAKEKAVHILRDLSYDGAHNVRESPRGVLTIVRTHPVTPLQVIYDPARNTLLVQRQSFRTAGFLERFHRRRGYGNGYVADNAWAVSVDVFVFGTIFWCLSGIWMWWEMRPTRKWGAIAASIGIALFAFFVRSI